MRQGGPQNDINACPYAQGAPRRGEGQPRAPAARPSASSPAPSTCRAPRPPPRPKVAAQGHGRTAAPACAGAVGRGADWGCGCAPRRAPPNFRAPAQHVDMERRWWLSRSAGALVAAAGATERAERSKEPAVPLTEHHHQRREDQRHHARAAGRRRVVARIAWVGEQEHARGGADEPLASAWLCVALR
eukprot:SAG11_NODE_4715_length_1795_cov_1.525943_1_plen_188_part_00